MLLFDIGKKLIYCPDGDVAGFGVVVNKHFNQLDKKDSCLIKWEHEFRLEEISVEDLVDSDSIKPI